MYLPKEILNFTKGLKCYRDDIGRSLDKVFIFEDKYLLKISSDLDRLKREKLKFDWLDGKVPGSKSICYIEEQAKGYYLRTLIKGDSLISERFVNNPELLIESLYKVIEVLRKLDDFDCPFNSFDNQGKEFVHGDLCLPNIYFNEQNEFIGFIDLENAGLGDRWYDYAWMLWSVWYNLKTTKYYQILLERLGIEYDDSKISQYLPPEYYKNLK